MITFINTVDFGQCNLKYTSLKLLLLKKKTQISAGMTRPLDDLCELVMLHMAIPTCSHSPVPGRVGEASIITIKVIIRAVSK